MAYERGKGSVRAKLADIIAEHGWALLSVLAGENSPRFTYTVGLAGKGLPELIIFGLDQTSARPVLNDLARRLVEGLALSTGDRLVKIATMHLVAVELSDNDVQENLRLAAVFADHFTAFQMVWPDQNGKFPWESGYDSKWLAIQPVKRQLQ